MDQKSSQYLNGLPHIPRVLTTVQFVLFQFRANRASYSARSPLIHSYGYASADDRTAYLAQFPLNSEPFMNYPG